MDVDEVIDIHIGRGKPKAAIAMAIVRELVPEDKAMLENPVGEIRTPLQRIKHIHHTVARLVAEGRSNVEINAITGMGKEWIGTLKGDPAFAELVEYYKGMKDQRFYDVHERLARLGESTVEELQNRIDTSPEKFTARELVELAEMVLDRSSAPSKAAKAGGINNAITIQFVEPACTQIGGVVIEGENK